MRIKLLVLVVALVMVLGAVGCKDKQSAPISQPAAPGAPSGDLPPGHPAAEEGAMPFAVPVTDIVIPDFVKGKWKSVKVTIEDKATGKSKDVDIALNSEYAVAGSDMKIKVGEFIPDFRMEGTVITSVTNEPNNPAAHITVTEGGQEVFKGWLYSRFPAIHPFQHDKVGLTLVEGK